MPLDSQAEAILAAMSDGGVDMSLDMTPQEMRKMMEQGSMAMEGEPVAEVKDMVIPGPAADLKIRVYRPTADDAKLPCVVFFHGGGWVIGSIDSHDNQVRSMVNKTGAVFVSVDYRLAPEDPFPAAVEDCYAATLWVADNADELGIDAGRIAVAGDSAGGNLAAVTAQQVKERGGPELCMQVLVYPCCDMDTDIYPSMTENKDGPFLTKAIMDWFYNHYMGSADPADPRAAPIRAEDLSGLPPALVITAEMDPLRDEGEAYAQKLNEAGVSAKAVRYDGMFHGFFGFGEFLDKAKEAQEETAKYVVEHFK